MTSRPCRARSRGALSLERYRVAQADEALALLATDPFEAVILDVSMPRVDGLEVCRRLREGGTRRC